MVNICVLLFSIIQVFNKLLERRKNTILMKSILHGASLIAQLVKNPPAMQETPLQFLGREDPLEKG